MTERKTGYRAAYVASGSEKVMSAIFDDGEYNESGCELGTDDWEFSLAQPLLAD
jgi:ABC-type xylose transport system substrate-binding protein